VTHLFNPLAIRDIRFANRVFVPPKMKAIELTETGGPEVMYLREIPTPTPKQDEVLIRLAVTGVNFIDLYVREGRYRNKVPFTPGQEAAGTVVAVGKRASPTSTKVTGSHGAAFSAPTRSMPSHLQNGSYRSRLVSASNKRPPPCCRA